MTIHLVTKIYSIGDAADDVMMNDPYMNKIIFKNHLPESCISMELSVFLSNRKTTSFYFYFLQ